MLHLQGLGVGGGVQGHDLHINTDLPQCIGKELTIGLTHSHVAHVISAGEPVGVTGLCQQFFGLLKIIFIDRIIHMIGRVHIRDGIRNIAGQQAFRGLTDAVHADLPCTVNIQCISDSLADTDIVKGRIPQIEAQIAVVRRILTEYHNIRIGLGSLDIHAGKIVAHICAAGLHLDVAVAIFGNHSEFHILDGRLALHIVVVKAHQTHAAADRPFAPGIRTGTDVHIGPIPVSFLISLLAEHHAGRE